jgi:hypothetical protein
MAGTSSSVEGRTMMSPGVSIAVAPLVDEFKAWSRRPVAPRSSIDHASMTVSCQLRRAPPGTTGSEAQPAGPPRFAPFPLKMLRICLDLSAILVILACSNN